jgi:hypothetical protein
MAKKIRIFTVMDPVTKKIPIPIPAPNINVFNHRWVLAQRHLQRSSSRATWPRCDRTRQPQGSSPTS